MKYPKTKKAQSALVDQICDMGRLGYSRTQIAAEIDIAIETLEGWESDYAIFAEGLIRAETFARAWWESLGQKLARDGGGQASTYSFVMKNRYPEDFRDTTDRRLTVATSVESEALNAAIKALDEHTCDAIRRLLEQGS